MRRILVMLVLIGAISGAGYWYRQQSSEGPATLRTAPVTRGDLLVTIAASAAQRSAGHRAVQSTASRTRMLRTIASAGYAGYRYH